MASRPIHAGAKDLPWMQSGPMGRAWDWFCEADCTGLRPGAPHKHCPPSGSVLQRVITQGLYRHWSDRVHDPSEFPPVGGGMECAKHSSAAVHGRCQLSVQLACSYLAHSKTLAQPGRQLEVYYCGGRAITHRVILTLATYKPRTRRRPHPMSQYFLWAC